MSWSPRSPSITPTCCPGRARPAAGTSSAGKDGTFEPGDVAAALDQRPVPRLLAITGALHVTGSPPPRPPEIIAAAHHRGIPVLVDGAQLAPHRPLPAEADFLAWSGHKMYAPFGAGVLVGPRQVLAAGDPFGTGGGAASMPDLDGVTWMPSQEWEDGLAERDRGCRPRRGDQRPGGHRLARRHQPRPSHRPVAAVRARGDPGGAAARARCLIPRPCRSPRLP